MTLKYTHEKKHTSIHIFRLITLDSLAAYTLHYFPAIRWFCADADSNGEHHPVGYS